MVRKVQIAMIIPVKYIFLEVRGKRLEVRECQILTAEMSTSPLTMA